MTEIARLDTVILINGFFSKYQAEHAEHFSALFGTIDAKAVQSLDNLLSDIYGDLPLIRKFAKMIDEGKTTDDIAGRIVSDCDTLFFELWLSIKDAIAQGKIKDYDAPFKERRTYNETRENITDATNVAKSANKVYGYDAVDTASNESGIDTDSTANQTDSGSIDTTEVIERSLNVLPTDIAQSQIDFSRNNLFLDFVFTDIVETVCLPIGL